MLRPKEQGLVKMGKKLESEVESELESARNAG